MKCPVVEETHAEHQQCDGDTRPETVRTTMAHTAGCFIMRSHGVLLPPALSTLL